MQSAQDVRIDKWLWATRVFKTRGQAAEACRAGHVKTGGQPVKPSHSVRIGEIFTAQVGAVCRTVKVLGMLSQRVGFKAAAQYVEDLTPAEEYQKRREPAQMPLLFRPRGQGRPSKRERRQLNPFLDDGPAA